MSNESTNPAAALPTPDDCGGPALADRSAKPCAASPPYDRPAPSRLLLEPLDTPFVTEATGAVAVATGCPFWASNNCDAPHCWCLDAVGDVVRVLREHS